MPQSLSCSEHSSFFIQRRGAWGKSLTPHWAVLSGQSGQCAPLLDMPESFLLCYYQLSVITPLCTGKSALIFIDPSRINAFKNLRHLLLKSKSMHFMFWHGSIDLVGGRGNRVGAGLVWQWSPVQYRTSPLASFLASVFIFPCTFFTHTPCLVTLPSLMAFSCWLFCCPQCSSRLLNSDQYPLRTPPHLPSDKLWMHLSHHI